MEIEYPLCYNYHTICIDDPSQQIALPVPKNKEGQITINQFIEGLQRSYNIKNQQKDKMLITSFKLQNGLNLRESPYCDKPLAYFKTCQPFMYGVRSSSSGKPFSIYIKTLTGRTIELKEIYRHYTTKNVMEIIQKVEGIPVDQQRLLWCGQQLQKDRKIFDYPCMGKEATFYLNLRLRGGGCVAKFVDLTNRKNVQDLEFAPWDLCPRWRICDDGLNLEGTCKNISCKAFNNMVIMQMGQGVFDFTYDLHKCKCPLCKKFIRPETCGYTDTEYTFVGIKRDKPDQPPTRVWQQKGIEVGNVYQRFDPSEKGSGKTDWLALKIFTKPLTDRYLQNKQHKCSICGKGNDQNGCSPKKYQCGHYFHDACFQKARSTTGVGCPLCLFK